MQKVKKNSPPSTTQAGDHFRHLVADAYRSLGALRVEEEVNLGGHAVDILAQFPVSAYGVATIAIECKSTLEEDGTVVSKDKAVKWANEVADLRRGQLVDLAVMVGRVGFSRPAREVLTANRIVPITLDEILIKALPFREYVQRFIDEYDRTLLTSSAEYLFRPLAVRDLRESFFARSGKIQGPRTTQSFFDLDDLFFGSLQQKRQTRGTDGWLTGDDVPSLLGRNILLLGEFGMGKTSYLLHLTRELCERWLVDPNLPVPIFVSLGEFTYETSLDLLTEALIRYGISITNPDMLTRLLAMGRITLLLDGADELVTRGDFAQVRKILQELSKLSGERARLIVSCRSHWLRDEDELARIVNDNRVESIIGSKLSGLPRYATLTLDKLNWGQIWGFLEQHNPGQLQELHVLFGHHRELIELAGIPVFLLMLTKIVDKLGGVDRIKMSDIYRLYADTWLKAEDRPSNFLSPEKKELFLEAFAVAVRGASEQSLHHTQLRQLLRDVLAEEKEISPERLDWFEQDIRTSSLLIRDAKGHYSFVHRSFGEYFYARWCYRLLSGSPSVTDLKSSLGRDPIGHAFLFVSSAYWALLRDILDETTLVRNLEHCRGKRVADVGFAATNLVMLASDELRRQFILADLPLAGLHSWGDWSNSDFRRSDLSGAYFFDTRLDSAVFDEASCVNAKFHATWMMKTSFENTDLTNARVQPGISLTRLCLTESGFIAGGGDGTLQIFEDGHEPIRVEGHSDLVNEISVANGFVASGGYADRTAILRSLDEPRTVVREWRDFDANIETVQFNADGSRLFIAELFGRILVVDIPSMRSVVDMKLPHPIGSQLDAARWVGPNLLVVLNEELHLLDGSTGSLLWKHSLGYSVWQMEASEEIVALVPTGRVRDGVHVLSSADGEELGIWTPPVGLSVVAVAPLAGKRLVIATDLDLSVVKSSGVRRLPETANVSEGEMLDLEDLPKQRVVIIEPTGRRYHVVSEVETGTDNRSIDVSPNRIGVGTSSGEVLWIDLSSFSVFAKTQCGAYSNGVRLTLAKNGEMFNRRLRFSSPFSVTATLPKTH